MGVSEQALPREDSLVKCVYYIHLRECLHSVMQVQGGRLIKGRVETTWIPRCCPRTSWSRGYVKRTQGSWIEQLIVRSHQSFCNAKVKNDVWKKLVKISSRLFYFLFRYFQFSYFLVFDFRFRQTWKKNYAECELFRDFLKNILQEDLESEIPTSRYKRQ